jgi:hypothetical protein
MRHAFAASAPLDGYDAWQQLFSFSSSAEAGSLGRTIALSQELQKRRDQRTALPRSKKFQSGPIANDAGPL